MVPLDGSPLAEQALPFAEALAELSGSPLLLLCASYVPSLPGLDVADEQVKAVTDAEIYLHRIASRLKKRGIAVETCAPYGPPKKVIAREAAARKAWLIAMATHGRGGLDRVLYGSVTEGVVRQSPVPVLLVRAWHAGDSTDRLLTSPILVPLDGCSTPKRRCRSRATSPPRCKPGCSSPRRSSRSIRRSRPMAWPRRSSPRIAPRRNGRRASIPSTRRLARRVGHRGWIRRALRANRRRLSRRWPKSAALR
ncbi:MAG: universal stress protein [Chloroflexia bacterium]